MSRSGLAQDMFDYIQGSDKLLTNQTVADYFHISKRTAEIVFKNEFHTTIHQFVTDSILKKARRYMNDYPHMKMSSIATALGFCDEFHFSKVFKSKLGMSPSAYKKKIRGGGYTDSGSS
jgi:transcriptional regulator GlxA family with amidase domain